MGLKISELVAELNKAQAAVGDLPVVFKAIEGDAETFLHTLGIELAPGQSSINSTISINHGTTDPTPAPEPDPVTTDAPAPAGDQGGTTPITE